MVFHTAPPQPASNARCTCMPELLGGAEASQNGFGERIPAKSILRSAMRHQPFMNRTRSQFPVLHGHHGRGSPPRADAVSPGINARQTGFEIPVHSDTSFFGLEFQLGSEGRSEEHTSELQSHLNLVCRLLLE